MSTVTRMLLALALLGFLTCSRARADILTPSQDTMITTHAALGGPTSTHGSDLLLFAIRGGIPVPGPFESFPLIQFDLTPFAGQTVAGPATLQLFAETAFPFILSPRNVSVHQILIPWSATTATFNNFGPAPGVNASDIGPALDTQALVFGPANPPRHFTWTIPVSVIQAWIDDPASNHGLLLNNLEIQNGFDVDFFSSENINPPLLTIQTSGVVPEPASMVLAGISGLILSGYVVARRRLGRRQHVADKQLHFRSMSM